MLSVETKDYDIMINGRNFFGQPVQENIRTNNNILNVATGQGDDYRTSCLLFYPYFDKYYKIIAIHLSKQQALDADPKVIQQINFTANLGRAGNTTIFFIIVEAREIILNFSQGTVRVLWINFALI